MVDTPSEVSFRQGVVLGAAVWNRSVCVNCGAPVATAA